MSLADRGHRNTVLLEAEVIGHGASGRNGGFVSGGFSLDAAALRRRLGHEAARRLYLQSEAAVERIRDRTAQHAIDCDAVHAGVIVASWFNEDPRPAGAGCCWSGATPDQPPHGYGDCRVRAPAPGGPSNPENVMAKYGKKASEKVHEAMDEMKHGELRSGSTGKKVTSRKQAVAIGLSEARRAGAKVPGRGDKSRGGSEKSK